MRTVLIHSMWGLALFACTGPDNQGARGSDTVEFTADKICTDVPNGAACQTETSANAAFEALRSDPAALRAFIRAMPKGGDLHSHLSGAVKTENLIAWAREDQLCIQETSLTATKCTSSSGNPTPGAVPIADYSDEALLEAWSMHGFSGSVDEGHDQFFAAFSRFRVVTQNHTADMLAAVRSEAASHNESYLELMLSLGTSPAGKVGEALIAAEAAWTEATLVEAREAILESPTFKKNLDKANADLNEQIAGSEALLGCGTAQADPGCNVETRYLVQVYRPSSKASVFAQVLHAQSLAAQNQHVVGLNLAGPEDNPLALENYEAHMLALNVAKKHGTSPVRIALHAGELVPTLLEADAQEHLTFHIRQAVDVGQAERIGHGIDILSEIEAEGASSDLLGAMRDSGVLVELCLSSNKFILGVEGPEHPMAVYRTAGVPVAIATDDEGVSRSTLTDEMVAAVTSQQLSYRELKSLVRRSVHHSFAAGESLFSRAEPWQLSSICTETSCQPSSDKERIGLSLERALAQFESQVASH